MTASAFKPLIFSGVQPTGNLHLGNYLGAIRKFVALQETMDCIYCVVDLHSLTAQLVHEDLKDQTRQITAAFLAAGIDPDKHIVFNQSRVMQHAELAWIFNCVARIGWMNRMTQFKDKAGKDRENASLGLLAYPSLMAADILVYRATHVPVGDDQKQHLELTRDIAQKFNNDFSHRIAELGVGVEIQMGDETVNGFFPLTEPVIGGPAARIMSHMVSKRLSREAGHRRKFLAIIDDTPECERAVAYASKRAQSTGGVVVMLYVIEPDDFQHWLGVEKIMREEANATARSALDVQAGKVRQKVGIEPELVIREGKRADEIHKLIEEDQDIASLVLAAGAGK